MHHRIYFEVALFTAFVTMHKLKLLIPVEFSSNREANKDKVYIKVLNMVEKGLEILVLLHNFNAILRYIISGFNCIWY